MGLYKRKDSQYYWMSFRINGRNIAFSTKTKNKKLAEHIHAKRLVEMTEGVSNVHNVTYIAETATMNEVFERYLKEVSPLLSPTSHVRNMQIIKKLKPVFGKYMVSEVTTAIVSRYKASLLEKDFSKATILKELNLLKRIFNIAIQEWELCKTNPVLNVSRTLGKTDIHRVRYLLPGELQRLMIALPPWLRPIVTIARHTGLRRGNILALTWEQVDLNRGVVIIPKTKNGCPIGLPLTQTAKATLSEIKKIRHIKSSFVFCDDKGQPHKGTVVCAAYRRAVKRARIEDFRFHDLRHDFASSLVQSGVGIHVVKELLGHKDLRMTIRYSHLAPENLRSAIEVLDKKEHDYVFTTLTKKGIS